jgi:glycosyltransferase involved in cell wall biosynthesis
MRIGIYDQRSGTEESGGTEVFIRGMAGKLANEHEIVLYTQAGNLLEEVINMDIKLVQVPRLTNSRYTVKHLAAKTPLKSAEIGSISMYLSARVNGIFEQMAKKVDVISTHYYLDNIFISRSLNIPTIFRFPGIKQPSPRWATMERFAKPDMYLANSRSTAERVQRWYDISIEEIVYAGVERDQFYFDRTYEVADPMTILFVGRIDQGKGLYDLLEAIALLDRADVEARIVGDGSLKSDLQSCAESLGIADQVSFPGSVPHDAVHEEYSKADIFCLPSHHESLGLVNIEAMLSGLPVISTSIDAIKEYITHEKTGLLVDPEDVSALTNALDRVTKSVELRQELGEAGQREAEDYTVEACAEAMIKMYQRAR